MKKCSKCQIVKSVEFFPKSKSEKDGLFSYCLDCKKASDREYYKKNKSRVKFSRALYKENNPQKVKETKQKHYRANSIKYKANSANYYAANKDAINLKNSKKRSEDKDFYKKSWKKQKTKRESDPSLRAIMNVRQRLAMFLKGSSNSFSKKLGCNQKTFKDHLESQFQPGMTWDNYGEWHIDHKLSLSAAFKLGPEEFLKACNYLNLQPLWAIDNIRKGKK